MPVDAQIPESTAVEQPHETRASFVQPSSEPTTACEIFRRLRSRTIHVERNLRLRGQAGDLGHNGLHPFGELVVADARRQDIASGSSFQVLLVQGGNSVRLACSVSRDNFSRDNFSRDNFSRDNFSRDSFSRDSFFAGQHSGTGDGDAADIYNSSHSRQFTGRPALL